MTDRPNNSSELEATAPSVAAQVDAPQDASAAVAKSPWYVDKRKRLMAALSLLAVIAIIVCLTFGWFVAGQSASTVGKVQEPKQLRVLGPNATAIEQIDMSYTSDNVDQDGKVTLYRPFCVKSDGGPFELQLANTTNISDLNIEVYRVAVGHTGSETVSGTVFGQPYYWTAVGNPIEFEFINQSDSGIAAKPRDSKDPTFGDYAGKENSGGIQANAAPLYRYALFGGTSSNNLDQKEDGSAADVTNFILKLQWTESQKETDVLYLIARGSEAGATS
ncbi:hypothetical protein ET524_08720 [Senegalimassilia faecalis]|uniref:Uncharacterized protein n=1 Tax=Senegalimassilia faecalis TaxID=2509433 RepID=A0A4Q2K457_9ACTN|nr:hypothetical protein [Senegalimassilia faecalis]RXZ54553.1 hypothetical protein ET524_08720 [Senegalimassilia faecalis]